MTDYTELKRLAEDAPEGPWFGPEYAPGTSHVFDVDLGTLLHYESIDTEQDACLRYVAAANPAAVLALIVENERLTAQVSTLQTDANSWQSGYDEGRRMGTKTALAERDQLKAENEQLKIDNGSLRGSTKRMGEDVSKMKKQFRKPMREIDQLKKENDRIGCLLEIKKIDAKTYRDAYQRFQAENETLVAAAQALRDEWRQDQAENEALRNALAECINSLKGEMLQKFAGQQPEDMHPVTRRDYDRDMAEVSGYRAALSKGKQP